MEAEKMEAYRPIEPKRNRGVQALIWTLSILLCVTIVFFLMVGVGFGRAVQAKAALAREQAQAVPSQKADLPDLLTPEITPGTAPMPTREPDNSPLPTVDPSLLEDLPELELNVQQSDDMKTFASIPDVVDAASSSVVGIIHYQPNQRTGQLEEYASGSGFIVSENGYVLTNAHVVTGAAAVDVLFSNGEKTPALVVGTDVTTDIAVLKMEGEGYPALPIGDSNALRVGEYVIAIGNPLSAYELYGTVTFGIISATAREINIDGFVNTYLQTDAAINFGNSGGPLINMAGQVIGMNSAKTITAGYDSQGNAISAEGIGFALPIQNVMEIANVILREGGMVRPGIGVQIRSVDQLTAEENGVPMGCRVEELTEGAPAQMAGLKVGDIITRADDIEVVVNDDVVDYVRSLQVGDIITFTVYRDGEYLTIPVTIGDMNRFED